MTHECPSGGHFRQARHSHSFTGHPALFLAKQPPGNYRECLYSNYDFCDGLAPELHEQGILVEPDSREP